MTNVGPRTPDLAYEHTQDNHVLVARAFSALDEMRKTEAFTLTEDSYTVRIPGKTLASWRLTLEKVLFRLRSEIE